eukprot:13111959-Ditylum_brightwellii.AAC.1
MWAAKEGLYYMKTNGVKNDFSKKNIHHAENLWKLNRVLEDFRGDIDEEVVSAVMDDYKSNEEDYTMYPCLPTWDDVYDMESQITAPMHT